MTQKEQLVGLIQKAKQAMQKENLSSQLAREYFVAEHLIANGVVVKTKPQTKGKCGSCVYAESVVAFGQSSCYVRCTNKEHITKYCKNEISALRQRTHLACKKYKEREVK